MSDVSRRDLVRIALAAASAGTLEAHQEHVHADAGEASAGPDKPKAFNDHEFQTIRALAAIIIPADEVSPSAIDGGAAEYIDLLSSSNPELCAIFTGGIAWLDHEMERRYSKDFLGAQPAQQIEMLDLIAYRKNDSPELGAGIRFFEWTRRLVVDAFYTSRVGIKDLGYMGNRAVAKFEIPAEAMDYALKRSPV